MTGGTWAVVPVKPLAGALGRLAGLLAPRERARLQAAMLWDLLGACRDTAGLAGALVVTADPRVARLARRRGAEPVADHAPPRGMDAGLARGLAAARAGGAARALALMGDLPLARPPDLAAALAAGAGAPVTLVPSRDGTGTNALVLSPPDVLTPALGPGSLARHLEQAARAGLVARRYPRPALALDVDTPDDLAALLEAGPGGATALACRALGLDERLGVACPR